MSIPESSNAASSGETRQRGAADLRVSKAKYDFAREADRIGIYAASDSLLEKLTETQAALESKNSLLIGTEGERDDARDEVAALQAQLDEARRDLGDLQGGHELTVQELHAVGRERDAAKAERDDFRERLLTVATRLEPHYRGATPKGTVPTANWIALEIKSHEDSWAQELHEEIASLRADLAAQSAKLSEAEKALADAQQWIDSEPEWKAAFLTNRAEIIKAFRDYLAFLDKANEGPILNAAVHSWKCPQSDIEEGKRHRAMIAALTQESDAAIAKGGSA